VEVAVKDIVVHDRIRNDYGDIDELAKDIAEHGLICPIAITPDYQLIAGERRLKAIQLLGWETVKVNMMTVEDEAALLEREIAENEVRKDFTFSERMRYASRLKPVYQAIAQQNIMRGTPDKCLSGGRSNEVVAEKVGLGSYETFRKAEKIIESAPEEMIRQLDEGQLSINAAYQRLKREAEEAQRLVEEAERREEEAREEVTRLSMANRIFESQESETSEQIDRLDLTIREQRERIQKLENSREKVHHEVITIQEPIAPQRVIKICDMISALIEPLLETPNSVYKSWGSEQKQEIFNTYHELLENMQDVEAALVSG